MRIYPLSILILLLSFLSTAQASQGPAWVADIPIPQNEEMFLVVKGTYRTQPAAEAVQKFIEQLMGTTPPDQVDTTEKYQGVVGNPYLVGMLFDSQERARWWINFSYRNRTIPRGEIKRVKVKGISALPYMPDPVRNGQKRLLSPEEAVNRVKDQPDIKKLALRKDLLYKFTDYPRNGDLRYEIEVMESKGQGKIPVMVDFLMVSALNGDITERLSLNLGRNILQDNP
jgi:hypothetical protein